MSLPWASPTVTVGAVGSAQALGGGGACSMARISARILAPIREVLRRQENVDVRLGWVQDVDVERKIVSVASSVHNLLERVEVLTPEGATTAWVIASNVYHRTAQGWRLVAHHASPGTTSEIQEVSDAPAVLH